LITYHLSNIDKYMKDDKPELLLTVYAFLKEISEGENMLNVVDNMNF